MDSSATDIKASTRNTKLLTCFKYRSGESALRCLTDGSLYFAGPNTLNDTLEARFDYHDTEANIRIIEQTFSEIRRSKGNFEPWIFDRRALKELTYVNNDENNKLQKYCENTGIFSAGQRPNDQAMWAYYADNSRGFFFDLDWSYETVEKHQLYPIQVQYSNAPRLYNRFDDWREVILDLAEKKPELTVEQLQQLTLKKSFRRKVGVKNTARALSIKHTDWRHENELRFISPKIGALPLLKDVLKRVHFIRADCPIACEVLKTLYLQYPTVELIQGKFHYGTITSQASTVELRKVETSES